jgi:hypothetical protein
MNEKFMVNHQLRRITAESKAAGGDKNRTTMQVKIVNTTN